MSESGYFLNFVMGCLFQSTADSLVILLFSLTWPFFYPFFVIPYLFIDNNKTAMCVDMRIYLHHETPFIPAQSRLIMQKPNSHTAPKARCVTRVTIVRPEMHGYDTMKPRQMNGQFADGIFALHPVVWKICILIHISQSFDLKHFN